MKNSSSIISPVNLGTVFLVLLSCFASRNAFAQDGDSGSPKLHLALDDNSLSFQLTGIPKDASGPWVLQSSIGLGSWEDLALFDKPAGAETELRLELAIASVSQTATTQQFFRARNLEGEDPLLRDFLSARNTWRRSGIDSYSMDVTWFLSQFVWQGTVDVRGHEVAASETTFSTFFEPPEPKTIDDWFDHLKSFIDRKADQILVTYDPVFGYPKMVSIDESFLIADEEQSWSITNFLPGR